MKTCFSATGQETKVQNVFHFVKDVKKYDNHYLSSEGNLNVCIVRMTCYQSLSLHSTQITPLQSDLTKAFTFILSDDLKISIFTYINERTINNVKEHMKL